MSSNRDSGIHLNGLNGIRAIAALAVVVSHTLLFSKSFGLPENTGLDLAGFGVSIFFSLSGFLITYLLLLEKKQFTTINTKAFYIRRILRIWPLYYFYLLAAILCIILFKLAVLPGSLIYYLLLSANIPFIVGTELPLVGHYWSLGVEEQFYLFWPWVVKKSKNLTKVLILFISIFLLLKLSFRILDIKTGISWPYMVIHVNRFECMAIGALGAVFFFNENTFFYRTVFHPAPQIIAWASIGLMAINKFHIASFIDNDVVAAITVVLIANVAANEKTLISLNAGIFNFLGKISFGIYVYHPLVLFFSGKLIGNFLNKWSIAGKYVLLFSYVLIVTVAIAWISYNFFEKKFLVLKSKFALIKSSS